MIAKTWRWSNIFGVGRVLILALALAILVLEFSFDLHNNIRALRVAIALDIVLMLWYFLSIFFITRRLNQKTLEIIRGRKAEVAYFLLILLSSFIPRLAAGFIIARILAHLVMRILGSAAGNRIAAAMNLKPSQTVALSFVGIIAIGTILLTFPAATTNGQGASFIEALFTMTSAACVSGLSVLNLSTDLTRFGQGIVLLGMQVGGLGIMVLSASFAVLVGGNIPSRKQAGLKEMLDISSSMGLKSIISSVTASTVVFEIIGAVVLFFLWAGEFNTIGEGIWWSIFHSVSAFCNAGLSLFPDGLERFRDDFHVIWVFMLLITVGGLGFHAIFDLTSADIWEVKRPKAVWDRLQMQTKVIIAATLILNAIGMLLFLYFEFNGVLSGLSIASKINVSLFQAVSLRSAGFSAVVLDTISPPTILFCIAFMFIGAGPGSTGGGIKITTAAVSLMALRAMLRGRDEVELFGRTIPPSIVSRSLSIMMVSAMIVGAFLTLLLATQPVPFENLFFETVSAFGTVGLSLNTSTELNSFGKMIIIFVMYVGRIGPLTLALAVGQRKFAQGFKLPQGSIAVG